MSKLLFARYGGLSPVNYKKGVSKNSYHDAPTRKGIYAFIYPYVDSYFWAWNEVKRNNVMNHKDRIRIFSYDGPIWCHFVSHFPHNLIKGSWVLVTYNELKLALRKVRIEDTRYASSLWNNLTNNENSPYIVIKDPYTIGRISTDHLEVFIDSTNLAKIR